MTGFFAVHARSYCEEMIFIDRCFTVNVYPRVHIRQSFHLVMVARDCYKEIREKSRNSSFM